MSDSGPLVFECELLPDGVEQEVLSVGSVEAEFTCGCKAKFHFRTIALDDARTVLDDSRTMGGGPFELVIGRDFALPIWEKMAQAMRIGEISRFTCAPEHVPTYPIVSKAWRCFCEEQRSGAQSCPRQSYDDLKQLQSQRTTALMFEFELLEVLQPEEHTYALSSEDKEEAIPRLREEGKAAYAAKQYKEALDCFSMALEYSYNLLEEELFGSERWEEVSQIQLPLLLNVAQCELLQKKEESYEKVILCCRRALEIDITSVKALFRRAKAYIGLHRFDDARADFCRVINLDHSLRKLVEKELAALLEAEKAENL